MPLRRRRTPDRHTFELVGDVEDQDLEGEGTEVTGEPADPEAGPTPRSPRRRRVVVAGAAALALVLGGAVLVDTRQSRAQEVRLSAARGGVLPLLTEPSILWKVEATDGVASVEGELEDTSLSGYPFTLQGRLFFMTDNSLLRIG
ncbi:hypothetical protein [Oerskovia flava]|uniref:hypothetical protein n=1 Tax=Oerskovia flava TaxID=2986422 RepID=UPI00223EE1F2|nr:hypothetical protein [Oerskovia sp. JB1-3-2]